MATIASGYNSVSAFSSSSDIEEAQRQIYEEIKSLEESIRALRSRHNTLVVISRLPPEILTKIFKFAAATNPENVSWVRVSYICSYWRAVALECSGLWSFIPLSRPRWAEEMLKRSKMSPLIVIADFNNSFLGPTVACTQSALKEVVRIQELRIVGATSTLLDRLLNGISGPAPLLESLYLRSDGSGSVLPDDIFNGETPRLRRLELFKCNIAWDSPLLSGITQLTIHSVSPGTRPSIGQLIDALERMPSLQTLDLLDTLPFPSPPPSPAATPPADRVVNLPCLSYVHISSEALPCAQLLDRLSYPATTTIKFLCKTTTNGDISSFLSAISRTADAGVEPHLRTLSAHHYLGLNTISLRASDVPSDGLHMPDFDHPRVHIEISLRPRSKVEAVLKALCRSLPLQELQVVRIFGFTDLPKDTWLALFGRLRKLKCLQVRGYCGHGLLYALSTERTGSMHQSKAPQNKPAAIYFPELRQLAIDDWYFGEAEKGETILEILRTCLMERCEHGAAIQELHITGCDNLDSDDIRLLEEIVVDVHWDGPPDSDEEDEEDRFADGCPACGCSPCGDYDDDKFIDGCPDCGYDPNEDDSDDDHRLFFW